MINLDFEWLDYSNMLIKQFWTSLLAFWVFCMPEVCSGVVLEWLPCLAKAAKPITHATKRHCFTEDHIERSRRMWSRPESPSTKVKVPNAKRQTHTVHFRRSAPMATAPNATKLLLQKEAAQHKQIKFGQSIPPHVGRVQCIYSVYSMAGTCNNCVQTWYFSDAKTPRIDRPALPGQVILGTSCEATLKDTGLAEQDSRRLHYH